MLFFDESRENLVWKVLIVATACSPCFSSLPFREKVCSKSLETLALPLPTVLLLKVAALSLSLLAGAFVTFLFDVYGCASRMIKLNLMLFLEITEIRWFCPVQLAVGLDT